MIVSDAVKQQMLEGTQKVVHAVAEPGKALLSFDTFRVERSETGMSVYLLLGKNPVACWEVPKIDFDNDEVLNLTGFIGNTQITLDCH